VRKECKEIQIVTVGKAIKYLFVRMFHEGFQRADPVRDRGLRKVIYKGSLFAGQVERSVPLAPLKRSNPPCFRGVATIYLCGTSRT
jgi:hypothetical protein